jgi:hypothetical protein
MAVTTSVSPLYLSARFWIAVRVVATLLPDCQFMLPYLPLLSKPFWEPGARRIVSEVLNLVGIGTNLHVHQGAP